MSKILANQIANYLDNAPIEIKEGLNIPTGKPLQVNGSPGTSGQVLSSDGTGLSWTTPPYFNGDYNALTNKPTIPSPQVNSDWNATTGVSRILNKPLIPPQSSVTVGPAQGGGDLTYNSSNGEFTFTPPNLSSFSTFSGAYADLSGKPDLTVYLTSYTETDPVFSAAPASGITNTNITNWNTGYSWGNHASAGYITAEADTLATVAARGATTTADVTVNDMTVNGDLTVIGTTTSNNQSTLNVAATEIIINDGQTGTPALDGFLKIDRGNSNDVAIKWSEGNDRWQFSNDGSNYYNLPIATSDLTNDSGYLSSYTETDPIFIASAAFGIGSSDISNWNTAFGWGNHASAGYLTAEADTLDDVVGRGATTSLAATFGDLTCTNLTVSGTTTQINTTQLMVSDNMVMLNTDVSNTPTENAGLFIERGLSTNVGLLWNEGTDRWTFTNDGSTYTNLPLTVGDLTNDAGYLTSFTETDPVFLASVAATITTTELSNWNAAYGWGDHSSEGYLVATAQDKTNWNAAYGWGDHSQAGYLTSANSTDTLDDVTSRGSVTTNNIEAARIHANGLLATGPAAGDGSSGSTYVSVVSDGSSGYRDMLLQTTNGGGTVTMLTLGANNISTTKPFTAQSITSNTGAGITGQLTAGSAVISNGLTAGGISYPTTPGVSGQVLTTDGAGNATWQTAASGGATVTTSDTAPSTPSDGDLWWKSDEGRLKVYYQDANTSQWVDASPGSAPSTNVGGTMTAHVLPDTNAAYDLGNAEYKIRHLFLSDNTLYHEGAFLKVAQHDAGGSAQSASFLITLAKLKDALNASADFEAFKSAILAIADA